MSFKAVVQSIIDQRPEFKDAVGLLSRDHLAMDVPKSLAAIYRFVNGTEQETEYQAAVDLVPGFRLIHRSELAAEIELFHNAYSGIDTFVPFMADDACNYVALDDETGSVVRVAQEYGLSKVADSLDDFWATVLACYQEQAYFLDDEGFLDYDFEVEGEIGLRLNPDCSYWSE